MLLLGAVGHVFGGVAALQQLEHAAVAMAEQMAQQQRIGRIAAGLGDADMEQPVAGMGGRPQAIVLDVAPIGRADAGQFAGAGMACGQGGGFRLHQAARLQQGEGRDLGVQIQRQAQLRIHLRPLAAPGQLQHRGVRRRRGAGRADPHAIADAHVHQADHLQGDQRLAHRGATHPQLLGQFALGGQATARRIFAAVDEGAQLVGDLPVKPWFFNHLKGHGGLVSCRSRSLPRKNPCLRA